MAERRDKYDFFNYEECDLCGDCLVRCQYMDLSRAEAIEEMKRLIAGEPTEKVHAKCISCYACDAYCPRDCHPYELILRNWYKRYAERGLPVRASYLMPATTPNFRSGVVGKMTYRERNLLKKWQENPPQGDMVLYPGCSLLTLPHLVDADFMSGITISGDWDLCCGEMYFRMGLFDVVERTAEKLTNFYHGRDIGTMLFACPAGLNMFRNVLPRQFGAEFSFQTEYLGNYLLDKVTSGEIEIKNKLNRAVAMHDSCHGRILGEEVTESARRLLSLLGLDIVEMVEDRLDGYCCGIAAGCRRYNPLDIYLASVKELRRAQASGADEMAVYCTACQITFTLFRWLYPTTQPIRHLLEYLKEATGEEVDHPAQGRSLHIMKNVVRHAFPQIISPRTYRIEI